MARNIMDTEVRRRALPTASPVGASVGLGQPPQPSRQPSAPSRPQMPRVLTPEESKQFSRFLPESPIPRTEVNRRKGPIDFREPREQAPGVPVPGIPGSGAREPSTGGIPPSATVADATPTAGFVPSGDPLQDLQQFYDLPENNASFLTMLNALKEAYPGRVSDVGASATGVWDKIVIDGITYDVMEAATGTGGKWMRPLSEGPVGSSRGGVSGGISPGGGTVQVGNDPFSQAIMGSLMGLLARPSSGLAQQALNVTGGGQTDQVNPEAQLGVLMKLIQNAPTEQSAQADPGFTSILDLLARRT